MAQEREQLNEKLAAQNAELQGHRNNLEKEVRARTEELRKAQKDLLRQERLATLGRVIASVSHDIRNPLSTIKNSLALLQEIGEDMPDLAIRALDRIGRSVERTDAIIEDLLDQTREPPMQTQEVDLAEVVRRSLEEVNLPPGVELTTDLASVRSEVDKARLDRCLANLVRNAWEAMKGEGRLWVRTLVDQGQPVIQVQDNGPGIPQEQIESVLEPFNTSKSDGTGLGLAIVSRIARSHGGRVEIESNPGEGTTVSVRLGQECLLAQPDTC
jgi:two-component system sensor histidine kinase HydH